eukprot:4582375-Amphidinium_carterae.1
MKPPKEIPEVYGFVSQAYVCVDPCALTVLIAQSGGPMNTSPIGDRAVRHAWKGQTFPMLTTSRRVWKRCNQVQEWCMKRHPI